MLGNKERKSRPYRKAVWLVIAWLIVLSIIPRPFYEKTREQIIEESDAAYKAAVETEYQGLMGRYEEARARYDQDLRQYRSDLADYEVRLEAHREQMLAYETEYEAARNQYDIACEEYREALSRYETAYEAAYKEAELKLFRTGIPFDVKVRRQQTYNNHVGNDWRWSATINNMDVSGLDSVTLKLGQSVSVYSRMVENDNVPDSGSTSGSIVMKEDYFRSGVTITQDVIVRENRGRYSGNTAGFTFTYTLTPGDYTVVVDESGLPAVPDKPTEPVYAPPIMDLECPVEPMEPTMPSLSDITVVPPEYDDITVSDSDVYSRNALASILAFGCSALAWVLVVREVIRGRRRMREQKIEAERAAFYAPEPVVPPVYAITRQAVYSNGEEERINCRYAEFLHRKNLLVQMQAHLEFLEGKKSEPYLQRDEDAARELDRQIAKTELEILDLEERNQQRKDPLRHLIELKERGLTKSVFAPLERAPFSKKCSVPELQEFFEGSHVSYFEQDDNEVYILNTDYILKYRKDKLSFATLTYSQLMVAVIDDTKEVTSEPVPGKADVIGVKWKYQTKSGKPDRRFAENPAIWRVYAGKVEYRIEECVKAVSYMVKAKAELIKAQADRSVSALMRDHENGLPPCFQKVCTDQWPDIDA